MSPRGSRICRRRQDGRLDQDHHGCSVSYHESWREQYLRRNPQSRLRAVGCPIQIQCATDPSRRLDYIRFFHLRSYDRINAPNSELVLFIYITGHTQTTNPAFIQNMERNSGYKFHEAQVALARQWVAGDDITNQTEATVTIPQEETLLPSDKPAVTEKVPIPRDDTAARQVVERFESGAEGLRSDTLVSDSVAQHMLDDPTRLESEVWLGTEEEEKYASVYLQRRPDLSLTFSLQIRLRATIYSFQGYDC